MDRSVHHSKNSRTSTDIAVEAPGDGPGKHSDQFNLPGIS